jgi:type IV pilus assembly protein PilA
MNHPRFVSHKSTKGFTLVEIMIVVVIMRQLGAAADQYFLEFGTASAALSSLVGSSAYVKALNTVANESYPTDYTQGNPVIVSGIAGARTLTYLQ